ncbi:virulence factor [Meridianimarinicoccus aquatilis]|uniref:Virulence factor domain-containing protein n=1 Tax=Meridianimarinicoccus aquatilis TaxID=2552766 RepID=A0A4R6AVR5_9RHOB|nr:virulence factor [Fluviibacterium aquatile]TDL87812.1 hypothetical protein E2L05_10760 [Fluviibacterium aquatile]
MSGIKIVYWRDIPAQVLAGRGRNAKKVTLTERFEQAIDRAAMRSGAAGTDDYLAQWRKAPAKDDSDTDAAQVAARIERDYDNDHLKKLIENNGWA